MGFYFVTTGWIFEISLCENSINQSKKKREAKEADKAVVASVVTGGKVRRFKAALLGPSQGLLKRRRRLE